jgi:hypothetical protein
MYSTKVLGNDSNSQQITNQSAANAKMAAAVKSKKAFVQTSAPKK